MGGDFDLVLPEPIIQRIQYFLNARQAARTTILSKSWNSAWLTRPNIDLDEMKYVTGRPETLYFPAFVKKTIQRYEESKLKIDSFSLRICGSPFDPNETIVKALEMGATRLRLAALFDHSFFILTNEVFAAENLVELVADGFKIDLGPDPVIRCSRLESLTLSVGVKRNANTITNIVSRCPLIKDLSMTFIYEYKDEYDEHGVRLSGYGYGRNNLGRDFGRSLGPIELPKLHNIRCLVLSSLSFDILFLGDLSSLFPSLKDLTLKYFTIFQEDIRVSSHSLEVLSFSVLRPTMRVEFDVPSIRKFTFEGKLLESLSFKSTSREWESHLSITCDELNTLWFLELSKLAAQCSQSKLHLSCRVFSDESFDYEVEVLRGLPKHQVENLIMDARGLPSLSCYALFEGLFRIFRPKFITQNLFPESIYGWKTNNYFLCKTLVQQMNEKCSVQRLAMHSLDGLKKVNVQVFDGVVAEWQDISWKSVLDVSATPKEEQKIRFGLEWRA